MYCFNNSYIYTVRNIYLIELCAIDADFVLNIKVGRTYIYPNLYK